MKHADVILLVLVVSMIVMLGQQVYRTQRSSARDPETTGVEGEIVDLVCYIALNARGGNHAACGTRCLTSDLPVGLKGTDGKTYLLIGDGRPINRELAPDMSKQVTARGRVSSRDGFNMIRNVEIKK